MKLLEAHNYAVAQSAYNGTVTNFAAYLQFGTISTQSTHEIIGFTADYVRTVIGYITAPNYLYARQKNGYISIYGKDDTSPTGVCLIGGLPNELEYLLAAFGKTGQLSPTEDLRTAH